MALWQLLSKRERLVLKMFHFKIIAGKTKPRNVTTKCCNFRTIICFSIEVKCDTKEHRGQKRLVKEALPRLLIASTLANPSWEWLARKLHVDTHLNTCSLVLSVIGNMINWLQDIFTSFVRSGQMVGTW